MRTIILLFLFFSISTGKTVAQCAMCTLNADGTQESQAHAINTGILYMLLFPLVIILVVGFLLWKNRKKLFKSYPNDKVN